MVTFFIISLSTEQLLKKMGPMIFMKILVCKTWLKQADLVIGGRNGEQDHYLAGILSLMPGEVMDAIKDAGCKFRLGS